MNNISRLVNMLSSDDLIAVYEACVQQMVSQERIHPHFYLSRKHLAIKFLGKSLNIFSILQVAMKFDGGMYYSSFIA